MPHVDAEKGDPTQAGAQRLPTKGRDGGGGAPSHLRHGFENER